MLMMPCFSYQTRLTRVAQRITDLSGHAFVVGLGLRGRIDPLLLQMNGFLVCNRGY